MIISLAGHGLCYGKLGICLETMDMGKGLGSLGNFLPSHSCPVVSSKFKYKSEIKKFKFNLEMEFFLLFHLGFCIRRQPSSCATMKVLSDENTYSFTTPDQNNRSNSPKDPCIHFAIKIHPIPNTGHSPYNFYLPLPSSPKRTNKPFHLYFLLF